MTSTCYTPLSNGRGRGYMTPTVGKSYTPLSNGRELFSHSIQPVICRLLNMSPYSRYMTLTFNLDT